MRKLKLYLDTSTISHLFAEDTQDKMRDTNFLWKEIINGKHEVFISPVVVSEVESCAEPKRSNMFERLRQIQFQILTRTDEVVRLADEYIAGGVLKEKSYAPINADRGG